MSYKSFSSAHPFPAQKQDQSGEKPAQVQEQQPAHPKAAPIQKVPQPES